MAQTNFGKLTDEQKTVWSREFWQMARNASFINQFVGDSQNSMIQRVSELKKTTKGNRAVLTLVSDLVGNGAAGDRYLEGREEAMKSSDQVIRFDQLRNGNRLEGRMAEQKSVVNFRTQSRDKLAYWLSDRMDRMAFLTLAGISYGMNPNGDVAADQELTFLEFAADVSAPTSGRRTRWDATDGLVLNAASSDLVTADKVTWNTFIDLKAYAQKNYIRGIRTSGGKEVFHAFLDPLTMATLKKDSDYKEALKHAAPRSESNPLFKGNGVNMATGVEIDGIVLHSFRHVPNTSDAGSGSKYGGGSVEGCQMLFCGAQALGMADIGDSYWDEKDFDYSNSPGISIGKMLGFLKPKFDTIYEGNSKQDFGVISCYVAR